MWFIFVLPMAVVGAVGAVLGLLNGGTILIISMATDQWHRRRGHRLGEGIFTEREGGFLFGLKVAKNSTDLGQFLAAMAELFPDYLGRFKDRAYDLTESEGELLRSMVRVSQDILVEFLEVMESNDLERLSRKKGQIEDSLVPIIKFLDEVPSPRVNKSH